MGNRSSGTFRRAVAGTGTALLLAIGLTTPVLGGVPVCTLQATVGGGSATEVTVGETVLIEGFGFPASVSVDLEYDSDGTVVGGETVTADAGGTFETSVVPQPGQEGTWTVTATVTKGCTATTGFLVVGLPATPTPTPSPTPVATLVPAPAPTQGELPNVAMDAPAGPAGAWIGTVLLLGTVLIACAALVIAPRRR
jgi:hypothetical protein